MQDSTIHNIQRKKQIADEFDILALVFARGGVLVVGSSPLGVDDTH
jgi:hypothetical protein